MRCPRYTDGIHLSSGAVGGSAAEQIQRESSTSGQTGAGIQTTAG